MTNHELWNMELFNKRYGATIREGIDLSDTEVRSMRLKVNLLMANHGLEASERAELLHIMGLARDDEFRPEFRPSPSGRMCDKKIHNISRSDNYRMKRQSSGQGWVRVCLRCEEDQERKVAK